MCYPLRQGCYQFLLLLLLLSACSSPEPIAWKVEAVGQIGGTISAIFSQQEIIYLTLGSQLVILDMSEPAQPKQLGQILLQSAMIRDLVVVSQYAYLVSENGELHIVDVSEPTKPVSVSSTIFSGTGYMVAVVGEYAYIALGEAGVRVIDISQPKGPQEVATIPVKSLDPSLPQRAEGVSVVGNIAYLLGWDVLRMVDISSPATPVDVGLLDIQSADRMRSLENYLLLMSYTTLRILDLSNPTNPSQIASYTTNLFISDVTVLMDKFYLASDDGMEVLSIGPDGITQLASYRVAINTSRIDIPAHVVVGVANQLYLTNARDRLLVVDVSAPTSPTTIGSYDTLGPVRGVRVQDEIAILEDYKDYSSMTNERENDFFWVVDVSERSSPQVVGKQRATTWPDTAIISESEVAIAPGRGLRVLDISDSENIDDIAVVLEKQRIKEIVVQGNYAYAISDLLHVFSITTPESPTLLSSYDFTPTQPRQMHSFHTTGIAVADNLALLAYEHCYQRQCNDRGVQIVDISQPLTPKGIAQYNPKGPAPQELINEPSYAYTQGVDIEGELAYVAGGDEGLRVVDISVPTRPVEVGYYKTPGIAWDVEVVDGYIYVANGDAGLLILQTVDQ